VDLAVERKFNFSIENRDRHRSLPGVGPIQFRRSPPRNVLSAGSREHRNRLRCRPHMRRILLALALVGCARDRSDRIRPDPAARAARDSGVDANPDWSCRDDGDCYVSCGWGAVNAGWYQRTKPHDCWDGCQMDRATCRDGVCVAWTYVADSGEFIRVVDAYCTKLLRPNWMDAP
jgi:hypothetical protein